MDGNVTAGSEIAKTKRYAFPGKSAEEAWRFSKIIAFGAAFNSTNFDLAVIVRILELIHEAIRSDVVLSKRYVGISNYG